MTETRRLPRINLIYYPEVFTIDGTEKKKIGHLVDLTTGGIKLVCEDPIEPQRDHVLGITVCLEMAADKKRDLAIEGKSVWCRKDINEKFWDVGFQFTKITDEERYLIETFIKEFRFNMVNNID